MIPYGRRQSCSCGRTWDTGQIPPADYAALRDTVRRFRRNEIAFVMVALGLAAVLMIVASRAPALVAIAAFALVWLRWFRPWWRLRKQQRLRQLPVWNLTAEGGPG